MSSSFGWNEMLLLSFARNKAKDMSRLLPKYFTSDHINEGKVSENVLKLGNNLNFMYERLKYLEH